VSLVRVVKDLITRNTRDNGDTEHSTECVRQSLWTVLNGVVIYTFPLHTVLQLLVR
jgi:uncharacterized protein YheU (UPF0270 family)